MVYEIKEGFQAAGLFGDWQETMIWSCVQGVMGHLYADSPDNPKSVMALLGDFCFFAGAPDRELVSFKPEWRGKEFVIMTARSPKWFDLIESVYGARAKKVSRYAFKKEADAFDREKLGAFADSVAAGYTLHGIDQRLYERCKEEAWSRDLVSLFSGYEEYREKGLGVVALKDGVPVAGASSYSRYRDGIEIEIDTKEAYRRQGLATACGAKLILACLERGLYPSWDAQNLWSVALAKKLGYRFDGAYAAYEVGESI